MVSSFHSKQQEVTLPAGDVRLQLIDHLLQAAASAAPRYLPDAPFVFLQRLPGDLAFHLAAPPNP